MNFRNISAPWRVLLVFALIIGVGFRFTNLDKKVFWMDEATTAIWVSGHSSPKMHRELLRQRIWTPDELAKFQHLNPGRGVGDSLRALADDDPKHPPLFYVLLRVWAGVAGDSVFALRLLPAILSMLVFPALWFLCRELFRDHSHVDLISLTALVMMLVSPFHTVYAQETREYSVWTAILLVSSALFLRALRIGSWQTWALYSLALVIGLYTHTLSLLLWLAHGTYLLAIWWRGRGSNARESTNEFAVDNKRLLAFAGACAFALLVFSPWALLIREYQSQLSANTSWISSPSSPWYVMKTWVLIFSALLFDPDNTQRWAQDSNVMLVLAARAIRCLCFAFILYALVYVWRRASRKVAFFICLTALIPFMVLAFPDLLLGGYRSTVGRFMIPSYLAVQLAVAYLVADKLSVSRTRSTWAGVLGLLVASGVLSSALSSQAEVWWNKTSSSDVPTVARVINAQTRPIILTEAGMNLLALSRLVVPDAQFYLFADNEKSNDEAAQFVARHKGEPIFFYQPTEAFREELRGLGINLKKASTYHTLWQPENKNTRSVKMSDR